MKYCILAAGIGSRNNTIFGLHKGLLPIQNKPMISHIIDKFAKDKEIIIALGHLSEQIKSYMRYVHNDRKIKFIEIENYSGKGSGPGHSLLQCKEELQCPFVFAPVDTFIETNLIFTAKKNWIGVAKIPKENSKKYCLVKGGEKLESLYYGKGDLVFNGIAGIFDYANFWKSLKNPNLINKEHQVITGFQGLKNVELRYFENFYDTGTKYSYNKLRQQFSNEVVFPKNNEVIFIDNNKVVKYFSDETKCKNRFKRSKYLKKFLPKVTFVNKNMFGYNYIKGELLSNISNQLIFFRFLEEFFLFAFTNSTSSDKKFQNNCEKMYKLKTYERIIKFQNSDLDKIKSINGLAVKPIKDILNMINWKYLIKNAKPANFHGDLQPENILVSKNKIFCIDWRESFGDDLRIGDFYYDLSKLYHGLVINGTIVKEKNFSVIVKKNNAEIFYLLKNNLLCFDNILESFCKNHSIDYKMVQLLGFLHFINIAEFYNDTEPEYSKFIFLLGKLLITDWLAKQGN